MSDHPFLDLAARAANLSERTRVVAALRAAGTTATPRVLPRLETGRIDRLAGRLSRRSGRSRDDIAAVLTAYRHHELGLDDANAATREVFAGVHASWLPTYQAALNGCPAAAARRGRPAAACAPFLAELGRRLEIARARHPGRFERRLAGDVERHLLDRFGPSLAQAVEADATFADTVAYHRFYLRFPVLGRWLAEVTALLAGFGGELIDRLAADREEIGREILGAKITSFRSLRLGLSGHRAGARSVAVVEAEQSCGGIGSFVYKPRCVRSEAATQELLARLRADGVLGFATRRVLARPSYGYEALVPAGHNRLNTREEADRVFAELGGHLAIFYVLGGGTRR
ncbi:DUF4135 domain-containing protein [Actinomadura sp. DC4]|uniref:DUF4135 domain-containing protein n=1 Tax=Actinomadura sp. DC4 TaxID=3055069 RepID=UPI0025B08C97|nr:DUF4135 domain-containing protein [Actinomadura sp. DC4]MDN3353270.1 DUF4135 domain-containing protein [Actinomadura sp. DC4]